MKKLLTLLVFFVSSLVSASDEGMIGEIRMFAGTFAPKNWAFCDGSLIAISQNSALFSILGTTYGGDGSTTFALPDLRGRAPIAPGQGAGLSSYTLGQKGGAESVTLDATEIPAHTHNATATVTTTVKIPVNDVSSESMNPADNYLAKAKSNAYANDSTDAALKGATANSTATVTVENSGGSQSHENRPPFIAIHYIICTQGIYPSMN